MAETSPLLKLLVVFAGILVLNRLRLPLYLALLLGGLAFNFWGGNAPAAVAGNFARALFNIDLWLLVVITALTVEFGRELADKRKELEKLQALLDDEATLKRAIVKEIEADAKKFGDARRTLLEEAQKASVSVAVVTSANV